MLQYQLLPDLTTEEYEALKADIRERGVMVPVEYDEQGSLLDGHHRVRACQELGIKDWPRVVRIGLNEQQKQEHVLALNLDRRHLTREQRQELVATLRSQGWSTRKIAEKLKVTQPTVVNDLNAGDKSLSPALITGKDGKQYPAQRAAGYPLRERTLNQPVLYRPDGSTERLTEEDSRQAREMLDASGESYFTCPECGEPFADEVWHCPVCDHHWPMHREDCWNCHEYTRPEFRTNPPILSLFNASPLAVTRAQGVLQAAQAEPERFGPLVAEMDRTGRVNGVFRKLQTQQQAERINQEPSPLPTGPFRVIVADPPWAYDKRAEDPSHRASLPYPPMSPDQIIAKARDEWAGLAADDAILWLWTTNAHMPVAFDVVRAWGFQHKTILTWVKDRMGTGDWLRGQSEHCIMAVRGYPTVTLTNQTTVIHGPLREHSRKPDEFYALVEALCPGSKLEMFARQGRDGWQAWGSETERFGNV